jgi:hypothetical protein
MRTLVIGLVAIGLFATIGAGCRQSTDQARELQTEVAKAIRDQARCPRGNSSDVQTLIRAAGSDGLVHIPAGCYQITETIVVPDGTRVLGAGMTQTVFYRDPQHSRNGSGAMLKVSGQGGRFQIAGIGFVGVRNTNDKGEDYGIILTDAKDFRVDHCYFEGFGFAAVRVNGRSRGVVDHSIFIDNFKQAIDNLGYGIVVYGTNAWPADVQAGTAEAVFAEDNVLIGSRHAIASNAGAHYVFRHNVVRRNVIACSVDAHGRGFGSPRGTRYVEIYDNLIEDPVNNSCGIGIRGGDGVIFGNTIRGFKSPILLILEWGTPTSLKTSYPAADQIRDLWIWGNHIAGGVAEPVVDETAIGFVEQGRDFFTESKPGYTPSTYPHPLVGGGPFDD